MKTITVDTYEYDELSKEAKARVVDNMRNINTDYGWWDGIFDDAKAIGELMGIDITNIYFSGFSSQGDGACFEGAYRYKAGSGAAVKDYAPVDAELHRIASALYAIQKKNFYQIMAYVKHSGHYNHEYCTEIDVQNSTTGDYVSKDVQDNIAEILRSFMRWVYRQLRAESEYLESTEAIVETIRGNGYAFTATGKRVVNL